MNEKSCVTPAGRFNELDAHNKWEENEENTHKSRDMYCILVHNLALPHLTAGRVRSSVISFCDTSIILFLGVSFDPFAMSFLNSFVYNSHSPIRCVVLYCCFNCPIRCVVYCTVVLTALYDVSCTVV